MSGPAFGFVGGCGCGTVTVDFGLGLVVFVAVPLAFSSEDGFDGLLSSVDFLTTSFLGAAAGGGVSGRA